MLESEPVIKIIERISTIISSFPPNSTTTIPCLYAIYEHCGSDIPYTMETGTGLSTILFSHISKNHKVFTLNDGNMMSTVINSELFNPRHVEFIEGPTQQTVPLYSFTNKFNVILLDGPHGYPFPDLEYYYLYPHLETGGILIIDDIVIPTIYNLFNFLKEDAMFELIDVVGGNTAFFKRTVSPLFNRFGDGWWLQNYNKFYPVDQSMLISEKNPIEQIRELRSSYTWKAASKAHRLIDKVFPLGSRRRSTIESVAKFILR